MPSRRSTPAKRRSLDAWTARLEPIELLRWAARLDPGFRGGGRQRAARAIEVALLTGHPLSYWQQAARAQGALDPWYIVLTVPRPVLHQRIARRAEEMVRRGLIEEVAAVLAEGHGPHTPGLDGIGIREAVEYLHGLQAARHGGRGDRHRNAPVRQATADLVPAPARRQRRDAGRHPPAGEAAGGDRGAVGEDRVMRIAISQKPS